MEEILRIDCRFKRIISFRRAIKIRKNQTPEEELDMEVVCVRCEQLVPFSNGAIPMRQFFVRRGNGGQDIFCPQCADELGITAEFAVKPFEPLLRLAQGAGKEARNGDNGRVQ